MHVFVTEITSILYVDTWNAYFQEIKHHKRKPNALETWKEPDLTWKSAEIKAHPSVENWYLYSGHMHTSEHSTHTTFL